jgi:hypothetical protein
MSDRQFIATPWTATRRNDRTEIGNFVVVEDADHIPVAYVADQIYADAMSAVPELISALKDEIDPVAALAGCCQSGLIPRCRCATCRKKRSHAALVKAEGGRP